MLSYSTLKHWQFPEIEHSYTADDTMFYALAVGLGADPVDERQLRFTNDTVPGTPLALPTMAVVLGYPGSWVRDPRTGIDFTMIVHGEEKIVMQKALPSSGTVVSRHRVTSVVHKGAGKGATVTYDKELFDKFCPPGDPEDPTGTFCRGDGGFSAQDGITDAAPESPPKVPQREPDAVCELRTLPQQALLYRLCADRNPLHSEPAFARRAGFDRPILHGLGTYGVACHALLATFADYDPRRLQSMFARFSAPVFPGETIRFEMYREGADVAFRARVTERERVVLDHGRARIA